MRERYLIFADDVKCVRLRHRRIWKFEIRWL